MGERGCETQRRSRRAKLDPCEVVIDVDTVSEIDPACQLADGAGLAHLGQASGPRLRARKPMHV